jgi:hypothetical protein
VGQEVGGRRSGGWNRVDDDTGGPSRPAPGVEDIHDLPIAQGRYTTPAQGDFYRVYFKTPDGRFCGILPNGGPVGCDAAPRDAPAGSNQTVVNSWGPATYGHSEESSFTRDVDVLPEGLAAAGVIVSGSE